MILKFADYIFFLLCLISAGLQYNDPDPYVWMPIYLYTGILCMRAASGHFYPKMYLWGIVVYVVYALYLFFDKTGVLNWANEHDAQDIAANMHAEKPWIEETREFFGLVIVIAMLLINWMYYYNRRRHIDV
ncbi:MAG: transmembrane 220 family protein [Sphingobacteriaceae bacterium]